MMVKMAIGFFLEVIIGDYVMNMLYVLCFTTLDALLIEIGASFSISSFKKYTQPNKTHFNKLIVLMPDQYRKKQLKKKRKKL
jgi:hypothetical protein